MNDVVPLGREECYRYVARVPVGRLGLLVSGSPTVVPVNFTLLGEDVVIRTGTGMILAAAVRREVVAFEADGWDATQTGWSVLIQGPLTQVVRPDDLARVAATGLSPWVPGLNGHVVRVTPHAVSGRRLTELRTDRRFVASSAVSGPDTPIAALALRAAVTLHPLSTITEAIHELHVADSPVGELGPATANLVSLPGLLSALARGVPPDAPARRVAGDDLLVLGGFAALLDALRTMNERGVTHAAVQPSAGQMWRVLTVADAMKTLLWVFDPLVSVMEMATAAHPAPR